MQAKIHCEIYCTVYTVQCTVPTTQYPEEIIIHRIIMLLIKHHIPSYGTVFIRKIFHNNMYKYCIGGHKRPFSVTCFTSLKLFSPLNTVYRFKKYYGES